MWEMVLKWLISNPMFTVVGAFTLVQFVPIKINPWSWVAKAVHGLLFGSVEKKLDTISDKVDKLEQQAEEDKAIQARTHILRFADELYNGEKHSKEYFDDILTTDIDNYESYCERHPRFKNSKTVMSTQLIRETYTRLMEEHKFL